MDNVPVGIVLSTKRSIYIMVVLCLCVLSFSIVMLARHNDTMEDTILGSFNCSIPLLLLTFCYIIWDNHKFYTSTRVEIERANLSGDNTDLIGSNRATHASLIEKINTMGSQKDKPIATHAKELKKITQQIKR